MLNAALFYARQGWPIFAIDPDSKAPIAKRGVYSATTNPEQIRRWWSWKPTANIAVQCRDWWVLDIDPRSGGDETLATWTDMHGPLPRTWTVRTGGGGLHYYFAHNVVLNGLPLGHLADGIDIKGNARHYVLVPPSKAGGYSWIVSPREKLATAPKWLLQLIQRIKRPIEVQDDAPEVDVPKTTKTERARRYARCIDAAISGDYGQRATWNAAMKITRGFDLPPDEALEILMQEWNERCDPPWTRNELKRHVDRAAKHGNMRRGELLESER